MGGRAPGLPEARLMVVPPVRDAHISARPPLAPAAGRVPIVQAPERKAMVAVVLPEHAADRPQQVGEPPCGVAGQAGRGQARTQACRGLEDCRATVEHRQANHQLVAPLGAGEVHAQRGQDGVEGRAAAAARQRAHAFVPVPRQHACCTRPAAPGPVPPGGGASAAGLWH
jgi:hypothetical protein